MSQSAHKNYTPDISTNTGEGLTAYTVSFVLDADFSSLPADVLEEGRKSMLDGFGLALSGSVARSGELARAHLQAVAAAGDCTVIGSDMKLPPRFAAFVNGVGVHADDYDDTQLAVAADRVYGLLTHPTATALPAAFAVAEEVGGSGKDLMLAYQLGVEVECKVAEAISPRHYQHGFHATGTCGTMAAAAAAMKLRGLDLDTALQAFSIAASQSAGLRENFGTMTKPFHAGRSSESGVLAADLAAAGWSAAKEILESHRGFFQAAGGGYDEAAIRGKLGAPWTFGSPGVSIKPHPSGSLTHPGMTEMLRLILENDLRPEQVEKVRVGTNHNMPNALIHHRPTNELQAKFSMEFCMAILLLERRAGLPEFTDEVVMRDDVREMIKKVDFYVNDEAEAAGYSKMTTIIDIALKDGRVVSGRADFGKGSPANPMTYEEVADKFRGCAEFAKWDNGKTEDIIAIVREIERMDNLSTLSRALSA
ncbi:MmgE/PrpD family protein [Hoeflea ulvae]|uniref:MmgE/PrpD family protein n=1 Tax=Hoeflea ulvae TaxID=2983764 RepID=A0ABT3YM41_9HYPH|nr:MmgE/PrpD family protein [Hoeflea ulvae]MCY0097001.1 MmgE/PrpD family protein [Hoeflea ulvae]